ncbi:MAG: phosphorylase [Candidatus Binatia bacterium]|nr:MAG: phosphorylase [Candidatus Binatia bacterium]
MVHRICRRGQALTAERASCPHVREAGGATRARSEGARYAWIATLVLPALLGGCGDDGEAARRAPIAVVSALPAEMAPIVARVQVAESRVVERWRLRRGQLGAREVVLLVTGVGMVNAENAMQVLLEQFEVSGVVVSGVAGSRERIGDVVVPGVWRLPDGSEFPVEGRWLTVARSLGERSQLAFDECTEIPDRPTAPPVCLGRQPALIVGGAGSTNDPFGGRAAPCERGGGEVLGCDVDPLEPIPGTAGLRMQPQGGGFTRLAEQPVVTDMETAVIARAALQRGLPFIAFRAVSDGAGDPLGLPGFPAQFFVYYRLAARNAAAATLAFLDALAE